MLPATQVAAGLVLSVKYEKDMGVNVEAWRVDKSEFGETSSDGK